LNKFQKKKKAPRYGLTFTGKREPSSLILVGTVGGGGEGIGKFGEKKRNAD